MSDLRTAAQQALEALEMSRRFVYADNRPQCDDAIDALRAALAQQDEPCPNCSSLEAQNTELDRKLAELEQDEPVQGPTRAQRMREAGYTRRPTLRELAEPVQEPVAWLQPKTVDGYSRPDLGYETCSKTDYGAFPAYTAPPQRKPLAEWQINDLMAGIDPEDVCSWSFRQGVYAAEKHHGVKS